MPVFGFKLLLVVICLAIGIKAADHSRLMLISRFDPQAALKHDPSFAPAAILLGNLLYAKDQKSAPERRVALGRVALRDQPLAADAIRQIGLARDAGRVAPETRAYMKFADRLSRRDGLAQIWLAQDRFKEGDVAGAMARIDTVMRVNQDAAGLIYPLLAQFTGAPGVAPALAKRSDAGGAWVSGYVNYLIAKQADPRTIARLLLAIEVPQRMDDVSDKVAETVRELAVAGEWRLARQLFRYGIERKMLDPGAGGTSIGWRTFDQGSAAAETRREGSQLAMDWIAGASNLLTVAQTVRFDIGSSQQASFRLVDPVMPTGSAIFVEYRCIAGGEARVVWRAVGQDSEDRPKISSSAGEFGAPCAAAVYTVIVKGPKADGLTASGTLVGLEFLTRGADR